MGGKFSNDEYGNSGHIVECDITWDEVWEIFDRLSGSPSHIYCMVNNRNIKPAWDSAEEFGFHFHNILPWDKGIATPNRWYMKNLEFSLLFKKGPAFPINDCGQKQLIKFSSKSTTPHPTEKPIELMANYIRQSTQPGALICDPFFGTGATALACVKESRKFVGCEINEEWFNLACDRISQAYSNKQEEFKL